jgi:hypothetical protein
MKKRERIIVHPSQEHGGGLVTVCVAGAPCLNEPTNTVCELPEIAARVVQLIGLGGAAGLVKRARPGSLWINCSIFVATASRPLTNEKHSPSGMKAPGLSATLISRSIGSICRLESCLIKAHLSLPWRSTSCAVVPLVARRS